MKDKCKLCKRETEISEMVSGECYKCAFDKTKHPERTSIKDLHKIVGK